MRRCLICLLTACGAGSETADATADGPEDVPAARWGHALAHDTARATTILFGGSAGAVFHGDTWAWDGARWTRASATGPVPRDQHVMAYDAARQRVVLFGGRLADNTKATD